MEFLAEDPIHPGVLLKEDFLSEYGLTIEKASIDLGIEPARLENVIAGKSSVDAELALRLSRYFATTAEFWLNLQRAYDLAVAVKSAVGLDDIQPVEAA